MGDFVHLVCELFSIIAVVDHQADVLQLQLERPGDLVHQSE